MPTLVSPYSLGGSTNNPLAAVNANAPGNALGNSLYAPSANPTAIPRGQANSLTNTSPQAVQASPLDNVTFDTAGRRVNATIQLSRICRMETLMRLTHYDDLLPHSCVWTSAGSVLENAGMHSHNRSTLQLSSVHSINSLNNELADNPLLSHVARAVARYLFAESATLDIGSKPPMPEPETREERKTIMENSNPGNFSSWKAFNQTGSSLKLWSL